MKAVMREDKRRGVKDAKKKRTRGGANGNRNMRDGVLMEGHRQWAFGDVIGKEDVLYQNFSPV